jgi:hypothetical protein
VGIAGIPQGVTSETPPAGKSQRDVREDRQKLAELDSFTDIDK